MVLFAVQTFYYGGIDFQVIKQPITLRAATGAKITAITSHVVIKFSFLKLSCKKVGGAFLGDLITVNVTGFKIDMIMLQQSKFIAIHITGNKIGVFSLFSSIFAWK